MGNYNTIIPQSWLKKASLGDYNFSQKKLTFKQTLLEWAGIALTRNKDVKINTLIAIPYNPYEPKPYQFWTMAGMLDINNELKVAEQFWDFIGGAGAYNDLLDCFEKSGQELRPEIDSYFSKFY